MKTVNPDKEYELLLKLVHRYFEGETTTEEEAVLRRQLVDTDCNLPEIEEARAVMGLFAAARKQARGAVAARQAAAPRRRFPFAAVSAAASVAVIIVAVLTIMHPGSIGENDMMASMQGHGYDSVARFRANNAAGHNHGHHMLAMVTGGVNRPDTPDEIATIIGSEMGLMAEAERSVYESIEEDFTLLRDIPLGE